MILDQGTLLSPYPIKLSIGTLRKPKLKDISELTFRKFNLFEVILKSDPERLYVDVLGNSYVDVWNNMADEQKRNLTVFTVVMNNELLRELFLEIFDFFFVEKVIIYNNLFVILKDAVDDSQPLQKEDILGAIGTDLFQPLIEVIQQICCIYEEEEKQEEIKFKNEFTRKMYERMQAAEKEKRRQKARAEAVDYSLPNMISAVSNRHPSINPINIWELTIYQLFDSFNRLQVNTIYDINSTRVAVWGDEKKSFDAGLWYKNHKGLNNDS